MTGRQYKESVLQRLCSAEWPASTAVSLVKVLRDVSLTATQLDAFVRKALEQMRAMSLQDVPELVYQLLLLSDRGGVGPQSDPGSPL